MPAPSPPPARSSDGGSVTAWVGALKGGDPDASARLWARYFRRMLALARKRLGGSSHLVADEEDVALSAFRSFCRAAEGGRFPRLAGRDELWPLLAHIVAQKSCDLLTHETRLKRGGGVGRAGAAELAEVPAPAPTPDEAASVADQVRALFDRLADPSLKTVALLRMEGYDTDEIAARLDCVPRTVERKLAMIRRLWTEGGS